jgi:acetyl esterase/lipase
MNLRIGSLSLSLVLLLASIAVVADDRDPAEVSVVYSIPGMEQAGVQRGIVFGKQDERELRMDVYAPTDRPSDTLLPAVVFIGGAEDVRDWEWFISYGRLAAATGVMGIVADKRYQRGWDGTQQGFADTELLLDYLRANGAEHGIDADRLCLWTFSAGGRLTAVGLRPEQTGIRCLVSFYGALDVSYQVPRVEDRAAYERELQRFSPLHAISARGADAPPTLLVRAGRDSPALNAGIERYAIEGMWHGADVTMINHAAGIHGFDGYDATERSREVIRQALAFVRDRLLGSGS